MNDANFGYFSNKLLKSLRDIVLAYCDQYLTRDIKTVNFDTLMQFLSEYFDWDDPAFVQLTNVK